MHQFARFADGAAESGAFQQAIIKAQCEGLGRAVVDGPAGRHHAAHADADQLGSDAGGEGAGPEIAHTRIGLFARLQVGQMATVDEDQLGHGAHRGDFVGA